MILKRDLLRPVKQRGKGESAIFNAQAQREVLGAAIRHTPVIYSNLEGCCHSDKRHVKVMGWDPETLKLNPEKQGLVFANFKSGQLIM